MVSSCDSVIDKNKVRGHKANRGNIESGEIDGIFNDILRLNPNLLKDSGADHKRWLATFKTLVLSESASAAA